MLPQAIRCGAVEREEWDGREEERRGVFSEGGFEEEEGVYGGGASGERRGRLGCQVFLVILDEWRLVLKGPEGKVVVSSKKKNSKENFTGAAIVWTRTT